MTTRKKIFVLYTGGTIGMRQTPQGLSPDTALAEKALIPFADNYSFDWHICNPLIDSSAVTLSDWHNWLALLKEKARTYDGILVLHGTDTLAYTANLFALALPDLKLPIVITGSQWPYNAQHSDAPLNLATAVAAFELNLPETVIAFNGKLFQAVGSSKISTEQADGFDNPHFGTIAIWSPECGWRHVNKRPSEKTSAVLHTPFPVLDTQAKVVCHTLVPGFSAQSFSDGLYRNADAVILQSYGHGNAPSDRDFIQAVNDLNSRGKLVLNISQAKQGNAAAVYAQGSALRQAGVVNGGKANLETALVLLTLAVSNGLDNKQLQQKLETLNLL